MPFKYSINIKYNEIVSKNIPVIIRKHVEGENTNIVGGRVVTEPEYIFENGVFTKLDNIYNNYSDEHKYILMVNTLSEILINMQNKSKVSDELIGVYHNPVVSKVIAYINENIKKNIYRWVVRNGNRIVCDIDYGNDSGADRYICRRKHRTYDRDGCIYRKSLDRCRNRYRNSV